MSTANLPLYLDDAHFNAGIERHPQLAKKLDDINHRIENAEDDTEYYQLVRERENILNKIVS